MLMIPAGAPMTNNPKGVWPVSRADVSLGASFTRTPQSHSPMISFLRPSTLTPAVLLFAISFNVVPAQIPATTVSFQIGEIPPQRVWYSNLAHVQFVVKAEALGGTPDFAAEIDASDGILGERTFDPATQLFSYVPSPLDTETFSVTFSASSGPASVAQIVRITPLRPLPSESAVFGLLPKGALPDPESSDFLDISTELISGTTWFNAQNRGSLRSITISGKTVVFEPGHPNELWRYHDNEDIRDMTIHAETLVIRAALSLPQTNVSIHATEVRFEDQDGDPIASLSTMPRSSTIQPTGAAVNASTGAKTRNPDNGRPGHDAGDLTLFTDAITTAGPGTRFILKGDNGERAGQGAHGIRPAGANRGTVNEIKNGIYYWTWTDNNTIYAFFDGTFDTQNPGSGDPGWPANGTNAVAGGIPGTAGGGGDVLSNLDLTAFVDNGGGGAGTRANFVSGGQGGTPRPAYKRYYNSSELYRLLAHTSSNGTHASGPASAKPVGEAGTITTIDGDLRWLSPIALSKVLLYVREAYLAQHFDYVRETLADYIELLELASAASGWADLDPGTQRKLLQILDELRALRHRVDSNLDFFSNPAGWVPMLSFEVTKLAFENEIPRALRVLYLNYWLGNRADTLQKKVDAMTQLRAQLNEQIVIDRKEYDEVVATVPGLQFQARQVQQNIGDVKADIETIRLRLLPKANDIALLKKVARALGAIAEVIPVGQPFVGTAGKVLGRLPDVDPDKPDLENAFIIGTDVAGEIADSQLDSATLALKAKLGALDSDDIDAAVEDRIAEIRALQQPVMNLLGESLNQMRTTQHPSPEVEAELQRLLAEEPEYRQLEHKLKTLNRQKTDFAVKLAETMQKISNLSLAITRNLLHIDILNRNIQSGSLILDAETLDALAAMNQRARERLLKYHYFMARAFEYRMVQPYDGALDLNKILDEFETLGSASGPQLTAAEFDSLRAVYEEQISQVVFTIFDNYTSNRASRSAPVRVFLPQNTLDQINAGQTAEINLHELGLFLPDDEDIRISDLKVILLEADYTGNKDDIVNAEVVFQHSGVSHLRKDGENYLFRHYNEQTRSKIEWSSLFDPFDGRIDPVVPSPADQSLLQALLSTGSSSPSTEDLLLYSRPAARAGLYVTRQVNSRAASTLTITRLRIEVTYDFRKTSPLIKTLEIANDDGTPQLYVRIGREDLSGRQNGEGEFDRAYNIGTSVDISAPESVGQYRFVRWEGTGVANPNAAATTVVMTAHTRLKPVYATGVQRVVNVVGGVGSGTYLEGEQVPISAVPPEGYQFVRWEGAGVADPFSADTFVNASADTTVQAIFSAISSISAWLGNISTRAQVGTGGDLLIPGFVIEGIAPKTILVRAVGPTLADFGVTGVLSDPVVRIFQGSTEIASNDDWGLAADQTAFAAAMAATGAFVLPIGSKDAAMLVTLQPGAYTAQVSGAGAFTGVSLVELYDAEPGNAGSRLVNISGRAQVGAGGDILIPGFVVNGMDPKQYLIRAVGPTLASFGVGDVLADPTLTVFQGSTGIDANDNWGSATNAAAIEITAATIGAFPLGAGSADAAVLITLEPGAYTIQVSGVAATTGVALVEVYEVQ